MSNDVSGYGVIVQLLGSTTFPAGITITQFSDDADAVDMPSVQIADKAMGVNGDLITWNKASPLPVTLNVIPDSDNDINLAILAEANRPGQGKVPARDQITLTILYPNGNQVVFSGGIVTDAMFANSIAGSGREKTKAYQFVFQNLVQTFGATG